MNKLIKLLSARVLTIVMLIVPTLLGAIYYAALASDRYVSEAVVGVKDTSGGGVSAAPSALSALLGGAGSPTAYGDTLYLETYIHSMELMRRLDKKLHLREHYASPVLDVFYKVWPWMSQEMFLVYFRNRVELSLDEVSGLVTIDVQAFEPVFAQQVAAEILVASEEFMNSYAHRIAEDRMNFAQGEVERAWKRSQEIKGKIVAFQTEHKLLDPVSQSMANSALTATLQATLTQQETALKAAQAYMQEDAYQVKTLRGQIDATKAQLETERLRATAGTSSEKLATLTVQYQTLLAQGVFADSGYTAAMVALEQSRMDSLRKLKTLVVLEPPTKPESAIYPLRFYNWMTVLAVAAMLYAMVRLAVATIREHLD
jgi:capsular polysaccharide transport system permease protein